VTPEGEGKKMNAVALCAPFEGMARMAAAICEHFDKPIVVETGDLQEGLRKSRQLVERGTRIIISRGGTAKLLRQALPVPIVEIEVTAYDILRSLQKVENRSRPIGIIGFENVIRGSQKLGEILGIDLIALTIHEEKDVPVKLEQAKKAGADIVIGDNIVVSRANEFGLQSILIESGEESILQSFREAYRIFDALQIEARKSREYLSTLNQLRAVLDSVDDQIILLDSDNRIQACNPAALRIFGKDVKKLKGQGLTLYPLEPLKERKRMVHHFSYLKGSPVLVDYIPIEANGEMTGTLVVGRNISRLQQAERKARRELYLKGHVARYNFSHIVSNDERFHEILKRAKNFASSSSTILILGETGTGKEMLAQSIHNERFGPERPFVAINCSTLPESLLESELFGYAPGAFTGARKEGKKGLFELAHGGTLLLDEIGELPFKLQSRLLRVIEERQVQPVGDDRVVPVDVRIIATTNRDIAMEVREKRYRADLFYRLNVLQFVVPPLRQRGKDAYVLFHHFVRGMNPKCHIRPELGRKIEDTVGDYPWPGNVRELKNLVERLAAMTGCFTQNLEELPGHLREELKSLPMDTDVMSDTVREENMNLKELELLWIKKLCTSSSLKKQELAKLLGISRTTLWKMTKEQ
jgi:transcriptional regulator with PAS, ATPase and Fis domain